MESILCRWCAAVVTISEHDYALARKYGVGWSQKRHLVPNAAESSGAIAKPELSPVRLLSVGRLTPVKNQKLLVAAMPHLPEEVTLTIVGEGVERAALEQLRANLGVMHRVDLPGEVMDIEPYLNSAQIFVLCSNYEGLPISILEAMCAGLPVVSTDVGGVSEAVLQDRTGFLVPRGDVKKLIARLRELIADPELRGRFGREGRRHGREHYTVARFSEQMAHIYANMLRKSWS
ncbi:MAG: glycosyltransferase [Gammaproteobacteria bacterium]